MNYEIYNHIFYGFYAAIAEVVTTAGKLWKDEEGPAISNIKTCIGKIAMVRNCSIPGLAS